MFTALDALQKRDALATQVASITSMRVTAHACRECRTVTEYGPPMTCRTNRHVVEKMHVLKRFFACGGCHRRVSTLHSKWPNFCCPNDKCKAELWAPCGAANGTAGTAAATEAAAHATANAASFLPRGVEHDFCLSGTVR